MSTIPAAISNRIAGTVRIPCAVQPDEGFHAMLSCLRRITTRSGKNSSTGERILWQEESRVRAGGTPYYDIVILRKDGRPVIAGRTIRDKREAEWLVHTLKEAVGLTEPGGSAGSRPLIRA